MKVNNFFQKSAESGVIRAECLFTEFLVEHNIALNAADHAGPLFRKMFPDSNLALKYACGRTKTSAILNEMANGYQENLVSVLQNSPFSLAIDGSNESDSKLYPIVVTYFNETVNEIKNAVLCLPNLIGDSTGENISQLIVTEVENLKIPISNFIAFGADNASVMVGNRKGVATFLKKIQSELIVMGCLCHLINLSADKAAAVLPVNIDKMLVDIFYYLEKSTKRKDHLKKFQQLHGEEARKILKYVCTRWLSLGRSLERLMEQWDPLLSFFHAEVKSKEGVKEKKKKPSLKKIKLSEEVPKQKKDTLEFSVEERIFYFLSSDLNKTFCSFLLNMISNFEGANTELQSAKPKIQVLKKILEEFLKGLFVKFVKPSVIKEFKDLTEVPFHDLESQKNDSDLVLGFNTYELVKKLKDKEKEDFFTAVRHYFEAACAYIIKKFPLKNEILLHAEIANIREIDDSFF